MILLYIITVFYTKLLHTHYEHQIEVTEFEQKLYSVRMVLLPRANR